MRIVYQHDNNDCGAACFSMIARYYGSKISIAKCRELTKTDRKGTNIYGIIEGAKAIGIDAHALAGSIDELLNEINESNISFPFIAHIVSDNEMLHFVVVTKIEGNKLEIFDPGKGKLVVDIQLFAQCWTGNIIVFATNEDYVKINNLKGSSLKFFKLLKGQYIKFTCIFLISFFIGLIGIFGSFVFQMVTDSFNEEYEVQSDELVHNHVHEYDESDTQIEYVNMSGDENDEEIPATVRIINSGIMFLNKYTNTSRFTTVFIAIIGLYIWGFVIQLVRGYLIMSVTKKIDIRLVLQYYRKVIMLPMSSVSVRQTGEYLSRFSDTYAIRNAISGSLMTLLMDSVMVVAGGVILYIQSTVLFGISVVTLLIYLIVVLFYKRPLEKMNRKVMGENALLESFFKESIDGLETIKSANAEEHVWNRTENRFLSFINSSFKLGIISFSQEAITDLVELLGTIIILWVGFVQVIEGNLSVIEIVTFYALLGYFLSPIKNIVQLQSSIQSAFVAADRLNDVLELESERETVEKKIENEVSFNTISISNLDFSYGNQEPTLKNINLKINAGEKIAIVGESGSGKSTLVKLLMRLYSVNDDEIYFDDTSINEIELDELRESISYVNQETFLFSDTIAKNLVIGRDNVDEADLHKACEVAQIRDFIEKLPMGYDTPLNENGSDLSGGQRQRMAIARALIKKPKLLILDEATSNLDINTEKLIIDAIFEEYKDITVIFVAHRLPTMMNCSKIVVINNGEIVDIGSPKELCNKEGIFKQMFYLYN